MKEWRRTQLLAKEAQMQERNAQKQKRKRDAREAADRRLKARSERLKVSMNVLHALSEATLFLVQTSQWR